MISNETLTNIRMFKLLPNTALEKLKSALIARTLQAEEVIFDMGDAGDELLIMQSGRVAVYTPSEDEPGSEQPIRIFEPPEAFGEMALIDHQPRSLSAKALVESQILVLHGDAFRRLLQDEPEMALAVMRGLTERIRYTTEFLNEVQTWVKKIADGNYDRAHRVDTTYEDPSIQNLAADFSQMAARVQEREQALRKEVSRLKIEIDQSKKERQVQQIVDSDYFQQLKEQADKLRGK